MENQAPSPFLVIFFFFGTVTVILSIRSKCLLKYYMFSSIRTPNSFRVTVETVGSYLLFYVIQEY